MAAFPHDSNQSDNSDSESSRSRVSSANEFDPNENNDNVMFENEADKERYLVFALRQWALEGGVLSMSKLDSLLAILNLIFPNVPKSYKTLLQTPLNTEIVREDNGGLMWYKGIKCNLENMQLDEYLLKYGQIQIDINMDGLPLHNNSCKKFWPILGKLVNTFNQPFTIAIYQGTEDPENVYSYLNELVTELQDLFHNGFNYKGTNYPVVVRNFILDRPARALVKCCVAHGAYGACEKCEVFGEHLDDRVVYLNLNAPLRTDQAYLNQTDPVHHVGRSPLEAAGINMVSQFRLDSFHLVYHEYSEGSWKKPRPMKFWKHYHGTEERRLCIYDGMLVFKDKLPDEVYKNFLLLQSAVYILASPVLVQTMVQTMVQNAKVLLRTFIEHSAALYGRKFVVLNVHSLVHLGEECEEHGPLENFSAFPFENKLKSIKEMLQTGSREIQQAARRDQERTKDVPILLNTEPEIRLSNEHIDPIETFPGLQYKKVSIDREVVLAVGDGERDSCFQTKDGDVYVLQNIT
ncbi:hypothetical protein FOCC_FOCC015456 [Frankliniella occidentalis]|nr:hypothetical protein FOCC_FOCC015456 [Frankliniella occidentalis]